MHSWTIGTFPATVVAVGLTATGVASAAPIPTTLDELPADVGTQAPIHTCPALRGLGHGLEKAPCLDTDLGVSVPNPARKADLAMAAGGVLDTARQTDGGLPRMIGSVVPTLATVNELARTRPTVDLDVRPSYPGVLEPKSGNGLLGAKIGPHQRHQNGVSALDTAAEVEAIHGYNLRPGADPLGMVRSMTEQSPGSTSDTDSQQWPTGVAPGRTLEGGLRTAVDALAVTLYAARSAA